MELGSIIFCQAHNITEVTTLGAIVISSPGVRYQKFNYVPVSLDYIAASKSIIDLHYPHVLNSRFLQIPGGMSSFKFHSG